MSKPQPSSPPSEHQRAIRTAKHMTTTLSNIVRVLELDADPEEPVLQNLTNWIDVLVADAHETRHHIAGMWREHKLRELGQR